MCTTNDYKFANFFAAARLSGSGCTICSYLLSACSGMSGIDQDEKALAAVARTYLTRFPECEHLLRRPSTAPIGGRRAATTAGPPSSDGGTSTSSPFPPTATSSTSISPSASSANVSTVPKSAAAESAQQMDVAREVVRLDPRAGGFSICGGADASCLPFGPFGSGVFVAHVRTAS